jgi:hypothetical protein
MQRSRDGIAHEPNEEYAKGHARQEITTDRAQNGSDDDPGGDVPEHRPVQISTTMTEHRGVERRNDHDDERSPDRKVHHVCVRDSFQRQGERQRRHDR